MSYSDTSREGTWQCPIRRLKTESGFLKALQPRIQFFMDRILAQDASIESHFTLDMTDGLEELKDSGTNVPNH